MQEMFHAAPELKRLTPRERDVCQRIVMGFNSEAIACELGVSLNTVLTYRRRAYERLGISAQNELFAIVMKQFAIDADDRPVAPSIN